MNQARNPQIAVMIAKRDCGDCQGTGRVHLFDSRWPCPTCHPAEYESATARFCAGTDYHTAGVGGFR